MRGSDLVVIGGGAAGITAAREGARRGARTTLVQDGPPGGDCTFTGCVPSKALLAAAGSASWHEARRSIERSIATIAATEDAAALARDQVTVIDGRATLLAGPAVIVDGTRLPADHVVIATGSAPAVPAIPGLGGLDVLTNESVFSLDDSPVSLAILGGGPVGCELATAFSRLGTAVTLIEQLDRVLPRHEPEAATIVVQALKRAGVTVRVGADVTGAERVGGHSRLHLADGSMVDADRVLAATGRQPRTTGLGLGPARVAVDERGYVVVDDRMATSAGGVWAIGDITGGLQLTHAAAQMAYIAVANALRSRFDPRRHRFDAGRIPQVTFTDPEVASVGLSEADAAAQARGARVAMLPLGEVDRGVVSDRTDGFVKLIAGPRRVGGDLGGGRLLGATIVAPRAGEMIHEVALAVSTGMFVGRLAQTVHAYPTWSMAIQQAALQFFFDSGGRRARPAARR